MIRQLPHLLLRPRIVNAPDNGAEREITVSRIGFLNKARAKQSSANQLLSFVQLGLDCRSSRLPQDLVRSRRALRFFSFPFAYWRFTGHLGLDTGKLLAEANLFYSHALGSLSSCRERWWR